MKRILAASLILCLATPQLYAGPMRRRSNSSSARASVTAAIEGGPFPSRRFTSCANLLKHVQEGQIEKYFVEATTDELGALSLMNDYGAAVGVDAATALLATLEDHNLVLKDKKATLATLGAVQRAAKMNDEQWASFTLDYLENLKKLSTTHQEDEFVTRVIHLQLTRFVDAVKGSAQMPLFAAIVKQMAFKIILPYARNKIGEFKLANKLPEGFGGPLSWITPLSSAISLTAAYLIFMPPAPPNSWLEFAKAFGGIATIVGGFVAGLFIIEPEWLVRGPLVKRVEKYEESCLNPEICKYFSVTTNWGSKTDIESTKANRRSRAMSLGNQGVNLRELDKLSPTQIAYIGQVDLLMAQADALAIEQALSAFDVNTDSWIAELEAAAKSVIESPDSYKSAAKFLNALTAYTDTIVRRQHRIDQLLMSFEMRVDNMKRDFAALKKIPFQLVDAGPNSDIIDRGDLLMMVVQTELNTIEKAKVERRALYESMRVVSQNIGALKDIVARRWNIVETKDVRPYAKETLLLIEKMKSLQLSAMTSEKISGGEK